MSDYSVDDVDNPEQEITEPTRRLIADELDLQQMAPNGARHNEVEFFSRLFNLKELPTRDHRRNQFPDMAADPMAASGQQRRLV